MSKSSKSCSRQRRYPLCMSQTLGWSKLSESCSGKRRPPNLCHGVRQGQPRHRAAAAKGMIPDPNHRRSQNAELLQRAAAFEGKVPDLSHGVRDQKPQQGMASLKGVWPNQCSCRRNAYDMQLLHTANRLPQAGTHNGRYGDEHNL